MDTFLYFVFFILTATTATESGYNYQQARPIMNQVFSPSSQFGNNVASVLAPPTVSQYMTPLVNVATEPAAQYLQPQFSAPVPFISQPPEYISPTQLPPVFSSSGPAISEPQYPEPQQQRETIISTDVFIHSAPEEIEEISGDPDVKSGPIKRNYRVIFVTAPTYKLKFNVNSLRQAQAAHEENTVIYVLSKKPDISSFQSQLSEIQTQPKTHKPEVYFINYKTQAEADRAQQEIQAQYSALSGPTKISDEGFAPIFRSGTINGLSNFVPSASSNQQRFTQPPFLSNNQGSAPSVNFNVAPTNQRYLPVRRT